MRWPSQKQAALLSISLAFLPSTLLYVYSKLFGDCLSNWVTLPTSFYDSIGYAILILYGLGFLILVGMCVEISLHKLSSKFASATFLAFVLGTLLILILLATSNTARSKAPDAAIMTDLATIATQVESLKLASNAPATSCSEPGSLFTEKYISNDIQAAEKTSGHKATCIAESGKWAIAVPYLGSKKDGLFCKASQTTTTQRCADSSGRMGDITGALTGAECPSFIVYPQHIFDAQEVNCVPQEVYDLSVKNRMTPGSIKVCPK